MLQIILYNFDIALEAIRQNKLRSFLTSLGIIFGVASVITMLAIGRGAQEEVLSKMKLLGTNNVIVEPIIKQLDENVSDQEAIQQRQKYSPGLTLSDMESIEKKIPQITSVSPEIIYETSFIRDGRIRTGKLVGVNEHYLSINNFEVEQGRAFGQNQIENADPVCIIGSDVKTKFFAGQNPVGKKIKAGKVWLTVIGVLKKRQLSTENIQELGLRNYNLDIYVPVTTSLLRYKNRSMVTGQEIQQAAAKRNATNRNPSNIDNNEEEWSSSSATNYHQIDKLIVQVSDTEYSVPIADVLRRMLKRRHNTVVDFEVIVPEVLLQQERRTQEIFNIVLSSIASISLIVGGIGIMNIMLASVIERYREIGIRRAVGAHERDIQLQFLTEALAISITGGVIGVIFGIVFSYVIELTAGIVTIVTLTSILISFCVAMAIGVVFGYFPARRAAEQDPVHALRYD